MKSCILVIDIGNTSTAVGIYKAGHIVRHSHLPTEQSSPARLRTHVKRLLGRQIVDGAAISSVVPRVNGLWKSLLRAMRIRQAIWVSHKRKLGIPVTYPKPSSIGADRLANAAGGVARYGAPLIIVDIGTAATFDVVLRREGFVGGVIAPGPDLFLSYLAERTAVLPKIRPANVRRRVGKSTRQAMQLGAEVGYRGLVREILGRLKSSPGLKNARVCLTGGFASQVVRGLRPRIPVDPTLTLFGVGRIYELNRR
jgi:type III pantothenate kinase